MDPKYKFGEMLYFPRYSGDGAYDGVRHLVVNRIWVRTVDGKSYFMYGDAEGFKECAESELFRNPKDAQVRAYQRVTATMSRLYLTVADFESFAKDSGDA